MYHCIISPARVVCAVCRRTANKVFVESLAQKSVALCFYVPLLWQKRVLYLLTDKLLLPLTVETDAVCSFSLPRIRSTTASRGALKGPYYRNSFSQAPICNSIYCIILLRCMCFFAMDIASPCLWPQSMNAAKRPGRTDGNTVCSVRSRRSTLAPAGGSLVRFSLT